MKRLFKLLGLAFVVCLLSSGNVAAQGTDLLSAKKNVIPGGYNFWVYTPEDYYYTQESTPLVLFLHGASLCGRDMNRALRYGTVAAIKMGREIPALVITPQNPGGAWNPKKLNDILEWLDENDYAYDHGRIYVLGMSLGGYGTLDFVGTYPEKVAAAMALCGGCTLKDQSKMGDAPLWIIRPASPIACATTGCRAHRTEHWHATSIRGRPTNGCSRTPCVTLTAPSTVR